MSNDRANWLKGDQAHCNEPPCAGRPPLRLVLLGPPGVGKGTQAELLHQSLGVCHLSTGDIFRAAKGPACGDLSPALREALRCMEHGELVPDDIVLNMIRERLRCLRCQGGFLLDGFPRSLPQAEALSALLAEEGETLNAVLSFELPLHEIIPRLSGRRVCPACKAVFHVTTHPPQLEGRCDHCGAALVTRQDDAAESIRVRMEAYEQSTRPLEKYYRERSLLVPVSARGEPTEILARTLTALEHTVSLIGPGARTSSSNP